MFVKFPKIFIFTDTGPSFWVRPWDDGDKIEIPEFSQAGSFDPGHIWTQDQEKISLMSRDCQVLCNKSIERMYLFQARDSLVSYQYRAKQPLLHVYKMCPEGISFDREEVKLDHSLPFFLTSFSENSNWRVLTFSYVERFYGRQGQKGSYISYQWQPPPYSVSYSQVLFDNTLYILRYLPGYKKELSEMTAVDLRKLPSSKMLSLVWTTLPYSVVAIKELKDHKFLVWNNEKGTVYCVRNLQQAAKF